MENIIIRSVTPDDAESLVGIYRFYVEHTAITFEYDVPSVDEFRRRIENTLRKYPYLAAQDSVVYAVDGYIVKDGLRCDKLVLVRRTQEGRIPENWSEIFVELKGTDIEHAIAQLRATLSKPLFRHPANDDIRARIVAQSFPAHKSDLKMEKAKKEFRQNYDCDLRGMKTGQEEKL